MSCLLSLFVVICWLMVIISVKSCSMPERADGAPTISNLELLNNNINTALLTINIHGSNNYYCKEMSLLDGSVGDIVECDDYTSNIREWEKGDIDPTDTKISSVMSNNDGTATATMTRNGQQITIELTPFDGETDLEFKYFTINAEYTTFITISSPSFSLYAIEFDDVNNNDNYTVYSIAQIGYDWSEYLIESNITRHPISVYQNLNILRLPSVFDCGDGYFVASYELNKDINNMQYNFTMNAIFGEIVDEMREKLYSTGYESVFVYNETGGTQQEFEPDLSSNGVVSGCVSIVIFSVIVLIIN